MRWPKKGTRVHVEWLDPPSFDARAVFCHEMNILDLREFNLLNEFVVGVGQFGEVVVVNCCAVDFRGVKLIGD